LIAMPRLEWVRTGFPSGPMIGLPSGPIAGTQSGVANAVAFEKRIAER
jgi:hypothetical protein